MIVLNILAKWIIPKFGSLTTLKWNCLGMIVWSELQEISYFVNRWEPLLVGRFIHSIHLGILLVAVPMFINEVAPKWCKGGLSVLHSFFINFGSLVSSILGMNIALGTAEQWHWLFPVSCGPMILQFVLSMFWMPESSYFLYTKKKNLPAATKSINFYLKDPIDKSEKLKALESSSDNGGSQSKVSLHLWSIIKIPSLRIPLLLCFAVAIGKTCAGQSIVRSYSTSMFIAAGLSKSMAAYATVLLFVESCIVSLITTYLTERFGRRRLLFWSIYALAALFTVVMSVSLTFQYKPNNVAVNSATVTPDTFSLQQNESLMTEAINDNSSKVLIKETTLSPAISNIPQWAAFLNTGLLMLWPVLYNAGIGSLGHFVIVEVFPTNYRSAGQALNIQLTYISGIFTQFAYLPLQELIGAYVYIVLFIGPLVLCGWIIWKFFPAESETKKDVEIGATNKVHPANKQSEGKEKLN